jgi:hypothetical protein
LFLHPWAIAVGLAAAALPIAIHLLTKPRPVLMPLSTIRFVREVLRQRRARHRLRDFLVLAARTLAVLLIAAAIARPRFGNQPSAHDAVTGSGVRVILLDASQSMAALAHGAEGIERARSAAASYLRYRPGLRANLIVAAASPRAVFPDPSYNLEALRRELSSVKALPERLDAQRAVTLAAEMLSKGSDSHAVRELVVLSDFQRSNWSRVDFSAIPADTRIQFETVREGDTPANLALLRAGVRGRVPQGASAALEVEVGNFSAANRPVTVEVALGDAIYRLNGICPAGRRTTLSEEITWQQLGWQTGEARLVNVADALAADDSRPIAFEVHGKPLYALVTRQSAGERLSSSHYLDCALVPDSASGVQASGKIVRVDPQQIDRQSLAAADVIVLDHPGKLPAEAVEFLAGLLRRGRAMFYVAAEPIDAVNLRSLAVLLGAGLRLPVEFLAETTDIGRSELFLASTRSDVAPFSVFADNTAAITGRLRFAGCLNTRKLPDALQDDLLATYNDGSACLTLSSSDAGSLAVLNADLTRSNFPKTEAFVPFVEELVVRLLSPRTSEPAFACGESLLVRLPATVGTVEGQLAIRGPEDLTGRSFGELTSDAAGAVWNWPAPDQVGVYRIDHYRTTRDRTTVMAVAVSIAAEESPLESLPLSTLKERLAAGRQVHIRAAGAADPSQDDVWTWLLVACVGCLLSELLLLLSFRS